MLKDFFQAALLTWIVLVILELLNPGMVHRFINLEFYFYGLIIIYIFYRLGPACGLRL